MKNLNILPADTYTVFNRTIITDKDKKVISMLYQPIIGNAPCSLYFTLIDDLDKQEMYSNELTHHHLMSTMQLKLDDIIDCRKKLEAVGLIKTYIKTDSVNQYVYLLYSPLSIDEFFSHPILNVVLYNNIGKKEYEKLINMYRMPRLILREYTDITCNFDEVFTSFPGTVMEYEDIIQNNSNSLNIKNIIDFNMIISSFSDSQISEKCFNDDVKYMINSLSYLYNLNTLDMQGIIRNCINERGMIDKNLLRRNCRDYYTFENGGNLPTLIYNKQPEFLKKPEGDNSKWAKMVYTFENITPYQLLKKKYKGGEPTERDKRLIESLMVDQKLNPGVINVLISYVLKVNNEQLTKSFVETIAGQWKRLNIETVEDAMKFTEKSHKKLNKELNKTKEAKGTKTVKNDDKKNNVPVWFNKENEISEATDEDVEEFDKLLNELI